MTKAMAWAMAAGAVWFAVNVQLTQAAEGPLAQVHFAGAQALQKMAAGSRLLKAEALPAARQWEEDVAAKVARLGPAVFNLGVSTNAAPQLRPLVSDWWQYGGWLEVRGQAVQRQTVVATRLPPERRGVWKQTLDSLKSSAGAQLVYGEEGTWLVAAGGADAAGAVKRWTAQVKSGKAPALAQDVWLQARFNGGALAPALGLPVEAEWPEADLEFSTKGEDVRVQGTLQFARAVAWKPEAWRIPRPLIHEPLVSFTAANGVAPWLSKTRWFQGLELKTAPNQVYGWSQSGMPLLVQAAARMDEATNTVTRLANKLPAVAYQLIGGNKVGDFFWVSNRAELLWQGLPLMSPLLKATRTAEGEFVWVQMFPAPAVGTNAPPELFAQVSNRPNLVYYSWEITEQRVNSWRQWFQLLPLFSEVRQVPANLPGQAWLQAAAPLLGNTVTEITFVSPQKMNFVRRGPVGLTGFELNLLARALDLWGQPADFGKLQKPPPKAPVPK
ncbi:MAG: hypothetical protein N3J91_08615 [Verrucomicrobiae bacterium]|nr:hypothetical protein [Verrucomicrobiae bacterium]